MDMFSVRGMGVAVSVSTSTSPLSALICSLWFTPKRCSSSMISSPRSLKRTPLPSSACVPTTTSIPPVLSFSRIALRSCGGVKRDRHAVRTGKSAKRAVMVL